MICALCDFVFPGVNEGSLCPDCQARVGWIPVSEKLPVPAYESEGCYSNLVLVAGPGEGLEGLGVGFYHHESRLWIGLREVTHWMPAPRKPPGDNP